jgi:PAS domain S-box-containing protein
MISSEDMSNQTQSKQCRNEVISETNNIVYAHDLAGNITFLNEAGECISGYSCEEACQMNIAELVAPEFAEQVRQQITRNVRGQFGSVYEIDIIARDGRRIALEVSTRLVLADGKPLEIQGIAVPSVLRSQYLRPVRQRCLDAGFVFGSSPGRLLLKRALS